MGARVSSTRISTSDKEKLIMIRKTIDPKGRERITVQWRDGDRVHTQRVATLTEATRLDGAVRDRGARR